MKGTTRWLREGWAWERYVARELERFPDKASRQSAVKQVLRKLGFSWLYIGGLIVCAIPLMELAQAIVRAISPLLPAVPGWGLRLMSYLLYFGFTLGWALGYFWLRRRTVQQFVRARLSELGIPTCLHCGYDLRGQTVPRCSECGKPFKLPADQKDEPTRDR
jgi:hypothetical protein